MLFAGDISRFESNGRYLGAVPSREVGHAIDLAFAPDGALWILAGNGRVSKLHQTATPP